MCSTELHWLLTIEVRGWKLLFFFLFVNQLTIAYKMSTQTYTYGILFFTQKQQYLLLICTSLVKITTCFQVKQMLQVSLIFLSTIIALDILQIHAIVFNSNSLTQFLFVVYINCSHKNSKNLSK